MSFRIISFFSSKLIRQDGQISITQDDENDSIMSDKSYSSKSWHYCNHCKVGFASKNRHDWHLDVCDQVKFIFSSSSSASSSTA
jgi:hypothetical protein